MRLSGEPHQSGGKLQEPETASSPAMPVHIKEVKVCRIKLQLLFS